MFVGDLCGAFAGLLSAPESVPRLLVRPRLLSGALGRVGVAYLLVTGLTQYALPVQRRSGMDEHALKVCQARGWEVERAERAEGIEKLCVYIHPSTVTWQGSKWGWGHASASLRRGERAGHQTIPSRAFTN